MPGGKPVTELPGLTPTLPFTVVAPVFVTVEPPRTPKFCAVPREICANAGEAASPMIARRLMYVLFIWKSLSWATAGFDRESIGTSPAATISVLRSAKLFKRRQVREPSFNQRA